MIFKIVSLRLTFLICVAFWLATCAATLSFGHIDTRVLAPRLQKHDCPLRLPDHGTCGTWQESYIHLHEDVIAGRQPARYLTVDGHTGLADRVVAAVSGLALAILTKRAFVLTEFLGGTKAPLSDVFCSPFIHWGHAPANMTAVNCHWERDGTELQLPCTFGKEAPLDIDFNATFGKTELVQIWAQNGLLSWLFARPQYVSQLNSLGLTIENAYGCLSNFIFQPAKKLQEQLPPGVAQSLQNNMVIGIQIRLGDTGVLEGFAESEVNWEAILEPWSKCASELETSLGVIPDSVKWLVITDTVPLRNFAQQKYADKVLTGSLERITHYTEGVLDSAAVDNWLFGLTSFKVISDWSSFGRSAALRVHGNASIYTVQQFDVEEPLSGGQIMRMNKGVLRDCNAHQPDRIEDVLSAWFWT